MPQVTLIADHKIENYIKTGRLAGCPRDQMSNFIKGGYIAIPDMLSFHAWARLADTTDGPEYIALGGKRGPGKSHTVMVQVAVDDMQRVAGLKVLFLRKIQKSASESMEDLVRAVCKYIPHNITGNGVELPNGSRALIGGYKDERDIDKYLGLEYDIIVIEEATQISETKMLKIRGSLRTSKAGWRPRIYMTTNADGIGLVWFKKMFIEPFRAKKEKLTRFLDVNNIDNPYVNDEYKMWLASLTGSLGKAWGKGDWDAFAGMAFPQWDRDRHVIKPFEIPNHWVKWRASDWGYSSPFCTLWLTKNPDTRRLYVYREAYMRELTDKQQARMIMDLTPPNEVIQIHYGDPSSYWVRHNKDGHIYTSADQYREEGVILTPADNDRINGLRRIRTLLADLPDGLPAIQFFETCTHVIEQMGNVASDPNNPEDIDTDQEEHAIDTLKYATTNEKRLDKKEPPKHQRNPMDAFFNRR